MKEISFKFGHGLGDNTLFAHSLPIYVEHGYKVKVNCTPDKAPIYEAAGCEIISEGGWHHYWYHPHLPAKHNFLNNWEHNKTGFNLDQNPYYRLLNKSVEELWNDLISRKLKIKTKDQVNNVISFVKNMGKYICLHTQGNTCQQNKNLTKLEENYLYTSLLDGTDCNLLLMDWDNRVEYKQHPRIIRLSDYGNPGLRETAHIIQNAQLVIGVDSGISHFTRFTETPAIGLWKRLHPAKFALPRHNTVHITENNSDNLNYYRRHSFNIVDIEQHNIYGEITANKILCVAQKVLSGDKANDIALRHYVRKLHQSQANEFYQDRHITFNLALNSKPQVIVETGCQRKEEDFTAGCSTTVFGWYARNNNCSFTSVDNDNEHIKTAQELTKPFPVNFICSDSIEFFKNYKGKKIDLLYLDSLDTTEPHHAEHCLEEYRAARQHLSHKCVLLIDDTPRDGKGKFALIEAQKDGFKILYHGYQIILLRS